MGNITANYKILDVVPCSIFIIDAESFSIIYSKLSWQKSNNQIDKINHVVDDFLSLIHPDDIEMIRLKLKDLKHQGSGYVEVIELRIKIGNDNYKWFELKLRLFLSFDQPYSNQVIILLQDINERKKIETALEVSELSYRNLFNRIDDAIYIQDESGVFVDVNDGAIKMYGYSKEEFIGQTPAFLSAEGKNDLDVLKVRLEEAVNGIPQNFEFWGRKKSGEIFLKDVRVYKGIYFGKNVLVAHARDITKYRLAEDKINAALNEKNSLLREVHHRVKNNLQAIIYLIEMQVEKIHDEKIRIFLMELQEQARTMSLVYEQLYQSDYLADVDMNWYLTNLATNVVQTFGTYKNIKLNIDAENILLDVETAMPCGLIVNELITNSIKYAFNENRIVQPQIEIVLQRQNNKIDIIVSDNGIGVPKDLDWENSDSLGLKLVNFWVKYQLRGTISLDSENGTKYLISFNQDE